MLFLLKMLMRGKGGPAMDPLQVSMTGVRMGERFLQIGCHDKALLAGLAAKVGLSGTAAVVARDKADAKLAESIARKIGALIEVTGVESGQPWPFAEASFDMVVVDDTGSTFRGTESIALLPKAHHCVRPGGRIEVVTRIETSDEKVDFENQLIAAGFKPVRILADVKGLRFVEGLRPN